MQPKIIIQSDNLLLRTWSLDDAPYLFELNSDPEVLKYTGDPPFDSIEQTQEFIKSYNQFELYNSGRWMIEVLPEKKVIGWCGLKFHPDDSSYDLGYRLFQREWGKGYATEASKLALKYGREVLNIKEVIANAMVDNIASHKVLIKLGFSVIDSYTEGNNSWNKYYINV